MKTFNRAIKVTGESAKIGTPIIKVIEFDVDNNVMRATGATVPTDGDRGYAVGCEFIQTDGGAGTILYRNVGSATSANFDTVPVDYAITLTPTAADTVGTNVIPAGVRFVRLGANVNGVTDFVTLPSLASVPEGYEITIIAGVANCEVRTPATSAEEINSEDCDGTKEYLLTATQIHKFVKIDNTIGWMGHGYTAIGAVATAVVPD